MAGGALQAGHLPAEVLVLANDAGFAILCAREAADALVGVVGRMDDRGLPQAHISEKRAGARMWTLGDAMDVACEMLQCEVHLPLGYGSSIAKLWVR